MVKLEKGEIVARAVVAFVNEHGAPNTVSPGELSAHYCGLSPLQIGLCMWDATLRLNDRGYVVRYANRALHIHEAPPYGA